MIVDGGFFAANMAKVAEGGYVPLLLASAVYGVMWIWHRGASAVHNQVVAEQTPSEVFVAELQIGPHPARAGLCGVPHPRQGGHAAGHCHGTCARTVRCTNMCSP